jgi:hypothetical protein
MLNWGKGQGTVEMLVLVGFFLIFSMPLISLMYLSGMQGAQDAALLQGRQAAREIAEKAGSVYAQGNGASEKITVVFPQNLQGIAANGRELTFAVLSSGGRSDVVAMSAARIKISGEIGMGGGPHELFLRSLGEYVEVSEG